MRDGCSNPPACLAAQLRRLDLQIVQIMNVGRSQSIPACPTVRSVLCALQQGSWHEYQHSDWHIRSRNLTCVLCVLCGAKCFTGSVHKVPCNTDAEQGARWDVYLDLGPWALGTDVDLEAKAAEGACL